VCVSGGEEGCYGRRGELTLLACGEPVKAFGEVVHPGVGPSLSVKCGRRGCQSVEKAAGGRKVAILFEQTIQPPCVWNVVSPTRLHPKFTPRFDSGSQP
jgi:hypothetical protein